MVDLQDDSINLRALRRIDDNIREILFSAGQVAIYYFNVDDGNWMRKEIEGALFFVERCSQPEYGFVVINKLNTINLVQKITKDFETNVQEPYLMYKNTENEIYCVWFYDKDSCLVLNRKIEEIIEKLQKSQMVAQSINHHSNGVGANSNSMQANSDLLKLLLSVENNATEDATPKAAQPNDLVKPIAQRRSVNLKDLFESHLSINSNTALSESSHFVNKNDDSPTKPDLVTPYQLIREEKNLNFPAINAVHPTQVTQPNPTSRPETKDMSLKATFGALLNSNLLESHSQAKSSDSENALYLSMEQLKKTLIYLLQNDADFLHSIHTAYVTAIKK